MKVPEDSGTLDLGNMRWDSPDLCSCWGSLAVLFLIGVRHTSWGLATALGRALEGPFSEGVDGGIALVDGSRAWLLLVWGVLRKVFKDGVAGSAVDLLELGHAVEGTRRDGPKRDVRDGVNEEDGNYVYDLHCGSLCCARCEGLGR